jgi:transportin-3
VTASVQNEVLVCLRNWVAAGEIKPHQVINTPLVPFAFEALASEQLFDTAVDVVCELIHETQELDSNMPTIQLIVPRIVALKPMLIKNVEDPEKMKGYARIFAEAGETYRMLIIEHTEAFLPILQAIGECSAYSDLDVVPITFPFWWRLAQNIGKKSSVSPLLLEAYRSLMQVMIRHLHYPVDLSTLTGQEAENFRSFRHVMGDTLKDCCYVLRTETCLSSTHEMLVGALAQGTSWQHIEAPLFALRSMGGQVDPNDDVAVPKIMDLIPQLPDHPRVRYAALLIIARYTEWLNRHSDYLTFQLQYISAGFESPDADVNGAAGQALRYVCQDCKMVRKLTDRPKHILIHRYYIASHRLRANTAHVLVRLWHQTAPGR